MPRPKRSDVPAFDWLPPELPDDGLGHNDATDPNDEELKREIGCVREHILACLDAVVAHNRWKRTLTNEELLECLLRDWIDVTREARASPNKAKAIEKADDALKDLLQLFPGGAVEAPTWYSSAELASAALTAELKRREEWGPADAAVSRVVTPKGGGTGPVKAFLVGLVDSYYLDARRMAMVEALVNRDPRYRKEYRLKEHDWLTDRDKAEGRWQRSFDTYWRKDKPTKRSRRKKAAKSRR